VALIVAKKMTVRRACHKKLLMSVNRAASAARGRGEGESSVPCRRRRGVGHRPIAAMQKARAAVSQLSHRSGPRLFACVRPAGVSLAARSSRLKERRAGLIDMVSGSVVTNQLVPRPADFSAGWPKRESSQRARANLHASARP